MKSGSDRRAQNVHSLVIHVGAAFVSSQDFDRETASGSTWTCSAAKPRPRDASSGKSRTLNTRSTGCRRGREGRGNEPNADKWIPEALAVSGFSREETLQLDDPNAVMEQIAEWIRSVSTVYMTVGSCSL